MPVRKDIRQRAHGPPPRGHGHGVVSQRTQASRRQRAVLCRLNDRIHGTRVRRIRGKRWTAQYSGSVWSPSNSSSVSSCRSSSISSSPSSSCSAVQAESSARSAQGGGRNKESRLHLHGDAREQQHTSSSGSSSSSATVASSLAAAGLDRPSRPTTGKSALKFRIKCSCNSEEGTTVNFLLAPCSLPEICKLRD